MTREQFKEFCMNVMADNRYHRSEAAEVIAAQWESDVNDARIAGQSEGVQSNYMGGMHEALLCPCCGKSI